MVWSSQETIMHELIALARICELMWSLHLTLWRHSWHGCGTLSRYQHRQYAHMVEYILQKPQVFFGSKLSEPSYEWWAQDLLSCRTAVSHHLLSSLQKARSVFYCLSSFAYWLGTVFQISFPSIKRGSWTAEVFHDLPVLISRTWRLAVSVVLCYCLQLVHSRLSVGSFIWPVAPPSGALKACNEKNNWEHLRPWLSCTSACEQ